MKRFWQPGTVHTYGFSPVERGHVSLQCCCAAANLNWTEPEILAAEDRLTRVYPHVVFVVCGAGEGTSTAGLGAVVRSLAGVCPDVDFSDVGGRKRPAAAFDGTFERFLSCGGGKESGSACASNISGLWFNQTESISSARFNVKILPKARLFTAYLCESLCASGGLQMF